MIGQPQLGEISFRELDVVDAEAVEVRAGDVIEERLDVCCVDRLTLPPSQSATRPERGACPACR
jgi:hypothetical protein